MKQILIYGDSLSWGIVPLTRERLPFHQRWPGVFESDLKARGHDVRVIEDCLNGRRTVWEDPYKPGRNGLHGLAQRIEACSPLAWVVLMLGTNDFQSMHPHLAWHAAQGVAALIRTIRTAPIEPGIPHPSILVIAPPPIGTPKGPIAPKFQGGGLKCEGLAEAYRQVCNEMQCAFFNAGDVTASSALDGVHLDAGQHGILGTAIAGALDGLRV